MDLALAAGARVLRHDWQDDFAAARNLGLDAARADWILYIDADERLVLPDDGPLSRWLPQDGPDAPIAGVVRFAPRSGYTRYREWRLFRNDPRLRFAGRFHETVVPAIRRLSDTTGRSVVQTAVAIDHLGYDADCPAKQARNLCLLRLALADDPGRVYCWHHLAETLLSVGDRDAALAAAAQGLAVAGSAHDEDQRCAASLLRQLVARDLLHRGQPASAYLANSLDRCPGDHALRLMLAQAVLAEGDAATALSLAHDLLSVDPDALFAGRLAFDRRIFGDAAIEVAALALDRLGHRALSAQGIALAARGTAAAQPVRQAAQALVARAMIPAPMAGGG